MQVAVGGGEVGELRDDPLPLQALDALQRARREGCWAGRAHGSRRLVVSGHRATLQCDVARVNAELRLQRPARGDASYAHA